MRASRKSIHQTLLGAVLALGALAAPAAGISKSPNDDRDYAYFVLPNNMQVLLISDPDADKAAAALDVHVGSGSDPQGREGLTHFLEHMLFLGTQKYPDPAEYDAYISDHGGVRNAYTSFQHTNYFFDVDYRYLEPALDRFSQFFVAPLFSKPYVERERQVVHSEYLSKQNNEGRRFFEAMKELINPEHPYARFSVGNTTTLAERDEKGIRGELIAHYQRHYSANLMALVVLGREPLPVLKDLVSARFSAVPNHDLAPLTIRKPLFAAGSLPQQLQVQPLREQRFLRLTFPIPPLEPHYTNKPTVQIAHLLGHEGKGSLLSLLKRKGWADALSAEIGIRTRGEATFSVTIQLTPAGLEQRDAIVRHVFQYLALIEAEGITPERFAEQRQMAELGFRFQQQASARATVRALAGNLHHYPHQDVMRGSYAFDRFDAALVHDYLSYLKPDNVLVAVSARELRTDTTSTWFKTPYRRSPIALDTLARWRQPERLAELHLPEPNPFIPQDLRLRPVVDATTVPRRLLANPGFELWYQQDTEFRVPRANFFVSLRSPVANDSPRHAVLTQLFVTLLNDQLNEFAYPADIAGLGYNLYRHGRGLGIRILGYNDRQDVLLARILAALENPTFDAPRFRLEHAGLIRRLHNQRRNNPVQRLRGEISTLLVEPSWHTDALLDAARDLRVTDLEEFAPKLLHRLDVVALAHGNLSASETLELGALLERRIIAHATPTPVPRNQVVRLEPTERLALAIENTHHDAAVVAYYQADAKDYATKALTALLVQTISSPFVDALRTENQLGYIVYATYINLYGVPAIGFIVQSPITTPADLDAHITGFIEEYAATIDTLDEASFTRQKQALLAQLLEAETYLSERTSRYWSEIDKQIFSFDFRDQLATAIRAVTLPGFQLFYHRLLRDDQRRRIVTWVPGEIVATGDAQRGPAGMAISDVERFREGRRFFPR